MYLTPGYGIAQPSTLNPQPSTLNPQPSTLNPQPQPSTLNSQPSTLNPQPSKKSFYSTKYSKPHSVILRSILKNVPVSYLAATLTPGRSLSRTKG